VKKVRVVKRAGSSRRKKKIVVKRSDESSPVVQPGCDEDSQEPGTDNPPVTGGGGGEEVHGEDAAVTVACDVDRKVTSDESQLVGGEVSSQEPPETPSDQSVKNVSFQLEQEMPKSSIVDDQSEPLLPSSSDQTMVDVVTESSPVCHVITPTVTPLDLEPTEAEKPVTSDVVGLDSASSKPQSVGLVINHPEICEAADTEKTSGRLT